MVCGYVRVSTVEQNTDRQDEVMKQHQVERIYSEKISGKSKERPKLQELIGFVREGDTIVVSDFSRLARNTMDLLEIVNILENKKVKLISTKEAIDTTTATGKLLLTVIGAISTFERDCLLERQKEGIALAKLKGVYKGRKPYTNKEFDTYYDKYVKREIPSKTELAKQMGISRHTVYKLIREKEYEDSAL